MKLGPKKKEEVYDFFEKIHRYIINGKRIEDTISNGELFLECNLFANQWGQKRGKEELAKNVCNIFINIYKKLKNGNENYSRDIDYNNDFAFLNYWVNWKIHEGGINESNSVTDFYNHLDGHAPRELTLEFTNDFIYDINKNYLNKMNILYNLYENYSKLNAIEYTNQEQNKEVLTLSTACCTDYIKVSYICNDDNKKNNLKFCEQLNTFISKHDALYAQVVARNPKYSDTFIKLSECPNNKIITTAVTGTVVGLIPLFGVLYKFTPMGQMFRSKKGILNNDEEMTKISLMEQENEHLKFQQGRYNIKYQSL
ncbi:VIR protein [Plasmodium vivax]|uniref:VIR protein n=1 Tax=Plasmodium vivax TaxID=5855 RepID=A0A1G4EDV1_PLAVI|nr:VIR protein [Plasmodium vivax]